MSDQQHGPGAGPAEDPDLEGAYGRLATALSPPPDAAARVRRRIAQRRRRRVAGSAVAVGVVVAGGLGLALTGDGTDRAVSPAAEAPPEPPALEVERSDGSPFRLARGEIACRTVGGGDARATVLMWASPRQADQSGERLVDPLALVRVRPDDLEAGRTYDLPLDENRTAEAAMLLFTAQDGEGRVNEASSQEPGASGRVEVLEATCTPEPRLHLRIDAVLGSETGGPPLPMEGEIRSP